MKKIISLILLVTALMSIFTMQTARAETENSMPHTKVLGNDHIEKGVVRLYVTNQNADDRISVRFETGNESTEKFFDFDTAYEDFRVNPTAVYGVWSMLSRSTGASGGYCNQSFIYDKSGEYSRIKIKLSDYAGFNADGTHNQELGGVNHTYNFAMEENGFQSSIVFFSGNAITVTAPDSQGYVEIYCSTDISDRTLFMTNFNYKYSSGGGTSGTTVKGVRKGDSDCSGYINVQDATLTQKFVSLLEIPTETQKYCADVDSDGQTTVKDATEIQRYITK